MELLSLEFLMRSRFRCGILFIPLAVVVSAVACDKVPLLAPKDSKITLSAGNTTVQADGNTTITATVLEVSGTPVQNGTLVSFTTTLGLISPIDARTSNGRVIVRFSGAGQSGEAHILASSGGATPLTEALIIKVGGAAASRIQLTANPGAVSSSGGSSEITAAVVDANGTPLSSIPVSFSTTAGSLSSTVVTTDASGQATTTLTTSREATVTATAGVAVTGTPSMVTVKVNTPPTVSIALTAASAAVGSPATFTVSATAATTSGATIQNLTVNFGDGSSVDLGATTGTGIAVQHVYHSSNTYTATATARDTNGATSSASTVVVVQPLFVSITADQSTVTLTTYTFTANVFPSTTLIAGYSWDFGDGMMLDTAGNSTPHTYMAALGPRTVRVTVTTASGQVASATTNIVVPP
jgi:Bacterial Ig-like domain (group 1)/PKD domain